MINSRFQIIKSASYSLHFVLVWAFITSPIIHTIYFIINTISGIVHTTYFIINTVSGMVHTVYFIIHTVSGMVRTIYFIINTVSGIVHTIYFIIHTVSGIIHTIYFIINTVSGIVHTIYFIINTSVNNEINRIIRLKMRFLTSFGMTIEMRSVEEGFFCFAKKSPNVFSYNKNTVIPNGATRNEESNGIINYLNHKF